MDSRRSGRTSLRLDAGYCAASAVILAVASGALAAPIGATPGLLRFASGIVLAWAGLLWWLADRDHLVTPLRMVGLVNLVAALGLAAGALWLVPSVGLALLFGAVAAEVAAFAGSQAVALRRLHATT